MTSRTSVFYLKVDHKWYVRGITDDAEGHFNANYLRLANHPLKKLRSESGSNVNSIRIANVSLVSDMDGNKALWLQYFEQLYMINP